MDNDYEILCPITREKCIYEKKDSDYYNNYLWMIVACILYPELISD